MVLPSHIPVCLGKTVNSEQEDKLVWEEVVLRMVEGDGTTTVKIFINCKEISFLPGG